MSVENPETANGTINETKPMNGNQPINGLSNGHIETGGGDHRTSSKHKSSSKDKHRDRDRSDHKSSKTSSSSNRDKDSDRHKHSSSSSGKDKHRDKDKSKSSSSSHKSSRDKDRERDKDKDKSKEHRSNNDVDKEKNRDRERSTKDDIFKEPFSSDNKDRDRKKEHKSSSSSSSADRKDRDKDKEKSDKDKSTSKTSSSSSTNHKSSSSHRHSSSSNKHSSNNSSKSRSDKHHSSSSSSKDKDRHRRDKDRHRSHHSDKDKSKETHNEIKQECDSRQGTGQSNNNLNVNFNDMKELKIELEMLPNHYNEQTCTDFPNNLSINEEKQSSMKVNNSTKIKEESLINISQASSCDYSMSQFRDDEPNFPVHMKTENDYYDNSQNDIAINSATDPLGLNDPDDDDENGGDDPDFNGAGDDDDMDEEDIPLAKRKVHNIEADSDDDVPLMKRKKIKKEDKKIKKKKQKRELFDDEDDYDEKPQQKKIKKEKLQTHTHTKTTTLNESPTKGRKKKEDEPDDVWRWWEEEKRDDGVKWNFLEHKGPVFAPLYERLPPNVQFYYDGKPMHLSEETEEVASFYAKMLNHDYVTKKQFNDNFFKDFRKTMTSKEKDIIKSLSKCNFKEMHAYYTALSEKNKNRSKEEKLALKEENESLLKQYGFCTIDGHKEKIGNFKIEPPGLFRGRGEHPKMGLVKRRLRPEDVSINCSKNSKFPEAPKGHRWKEIRHDNSVTWLASWVENVQGQVKYIMLNPSSKLKGEKDHQKYEVARRLDKQIDKIRSTYREEWKSKEMRIRQRGVALYFIDKLALRAGNEKDEDQADTVGCCSLRVEHVALHKKMNDKENVVVFDFLGKDSIRYYNEVEVEKRVFKNLELFMENKKEGDELFDRLNTSILNDHLRDLMEGLTAKVFRTYNASITLQNQLNLLTDPDASIPEKLLAYNRANRAVAVLCNHQRSVPKSHEKSMENLKEKIRVKRELIDDGENEYEDLKKAAKRGSVKEKLNADKKLKQLQRLKEQLKKLELQETDRDENKTIALGTSKLNYLDPRISVAWCKKHGVPLEKIFNKTQRDKFRWAIHMADENYVF